MLRYAMLRYATLRYGAVAAHNPVTPPEATALLQRIVQRVVQYVLQRACVCVCVKRRVCSLTVVSPDVHPRCFVRCRRRSPADRDG